MGAPGVHALDVASHPEAYALEITPHGIQADANSYAGLVHAWQTLKQIGSPVTMAIGGDHVRPLSAENRRYALSAVSLRVWQL